MSILLVVKACFKAAEGFLPNKMAKQDMPSSYQSALVAATNESSYVLIAIDFLTNLYHGLKIVKKSKAGKDG